MSIGKFNWLLSEAELTQEMLAVLACTGRPHLNQVLNNVPRRGHQTRKRLVKLRWSEGHENAGEFILTDEMLHELGWDREGKLLTPTAREVRGTFHKELYCMFGAATETPCHQPATWAATFHGKRTGLAWCDEHKVEPLTGSSHSVERISATDGQTESASAIAANQS